MRESVGKRVTREMFFTECVSRWLSRKQVREGNFLLLLGEEPRELPYLDALGTPRANVFSVEREEALYCLQETQQLGVQLRHSEVTNYLTTLLDGNQDFLVFNLDVEGSYFAQLDPAMTPVLLICWRNPETIVATYSSVGRDSGMLWEGVKSLTLFLWLARDRTLETLASLVARYHEAGFTEPMNMAIRDFLWLRSLLEHTFVASATVGTAAREVTLRWFRKADLLWQSVARWRRVPLRVGALVELVELAVAQDADKRELITDSPSCLGSTIATLRHVVYNAERPWSQLCYFTKFRVLEEVVNCRVWLHHGLTLLLQKPLVYINREGIRYDLVTRLSSDANLEATIVWDNHDLYERFSPRRLEIPEVSERLIAVSQHALQMKGAHSFFDHNGRREVKMPKKRKAAPVLVAKGQLTDDGKRRVQRLARADPSATTDELLALLPAAVRRLPKSSIVAHVAIGRRGL